MKKQDNTLFNGIGKQLPFSVPENYFEEFASRIDLEIAQSKPGATKRFFGPWLYTAAAAVAAIVILIPATLRNQQNEQTTNSKTENYETYVLSQVDETAMLDYYVNESNSR